MAEVQQQSQRNFRSAYLEKVGIKGVDEKKSLEIILKDKYVDAAKLEQFCLRFPLPATYRTYVWKILLGILPTHKDASDFVKKQRQEQYNNLRETLLVMRRITEETPIPQVHIRMHLVEQGRLPLKENNMFDKEMNKAFLALSAGICQIEDNLIDCYWLTKKISLLIQEQVNHLLPSMTEQLGCYLKKEDPQLHSHLQVTCSLSAIPTTQWLLSCFASTLPESAFERVCDRVIGGAFQLLIFVGVSVLIVMRRQLMSKTSNDDILKYLEKVPDESGDLILIKALELWQKHGSQLVPVTNTADSVPFSDRGHT